MTTVVSILDGDGWDGRTDIIVVADPERRVLRSIPRDLWCDQLGDRINMAHKVGGHIALTAALAEHGVIVDHSLCVRREATEKAIEGLTVTVPVLAPLEFWYPLLPNLPIEEGRKRVSFTPPSETLTGERLHQWIGARFSVASLASDLDRIRRQQVLLVKLLEDGFDFAAVVSDPALVSSSSDRALADLNGIDSTWSLEALDDVIDATFDGAAVLLARASRQKLRRPVPILMYHRVGDPPDRFPWPDLYVTPEELRQHVGELARRGYRAVTQRQLHDGWHTLCDLPPKPVVLSFDDGHVSVWRHGLPILNTTRWCAVLNLDVSNLRRPDGLTPAMIRDLLGASWELASHSLSHPDLTQLDATQLDSEVRKSRRLLRDRFRVPVDFFCYPSGQFSPAVSTAVRQAGYLGATTTRPGLATPEDMYGLPRVRVSRGETAEMVGDRIESLERREM